MLDAVGTITLPSTDRLGDKMRAMLGAMNYDPLTGVSDWVSLEGDTLPGGTRISRHGDSVFRAGSWLRTHHVVRSRYANGAERLEHPDFPAIKIGGHGDTKIAARLEGFAFAIDADAWTTLAETGIHAGIDTTIHAVTPDGILDGMMNDSAEAIIDAMIKTGATDNADALEIADAPEGTRTSKWSSAIHGTRLPLDLRARQRAHQDRMFRRG